jgi:hypothetical protein
MKSLTTYIIFTALIVTGRGCEEMLHADEMLPDQEYFFLYEYINYAWGYQHSGWLMDSSGTVRYFEVPEKWMVPSTDAAIEITGIENYIARSDSVITRVDQGELYSKVQLIDAAAKGTLTEPENVMADAGTRSYYALRYDPDQSVYERILLKQAGDWEIDNISGAAGDLYDWLKSLTD